MQKEHIFHQRIICQKQILLVGKIVIWVGGFYGAKISAFKSNEI
jgi:hypothetical protein